MKHPYLQLMRFHKPIGIFLLLWPTWWALWFSAKGIPSIKNLFIFTAGVILMRAAGCIINDLADRKLDCHVARTNQRPITSGQVSVKQALLLFCTICFGAFILVLNTNKLTIILSCFALFFAILYPFMKRYTHWPQLVLGVAFSFSIPMAFAAQTNTVPILAWILMLTNLIWTITYDTEYAMVDLEDDQVIGVKSTAILFGEKNPLMIGILQTVMIIMLFIIGIWQNISWLFYISLIAASGLFIYQQKLLRSNDPKKYYKAFLNNHWLGLIIFVGIFLNFIKT